MLLCIVFTTCRFCGLLSPDPSSSEDLRLLLFKLMLVLLLCFSIWMAMHLSTLNAICHFADHSHRRFKSNWDARTSSSSFTAAQIFVSSANFTNFEGIQCPDEGDQALTLEALHLPPRPSWNPFPWSSLFASFLSTTSLSISAPFR